MINTFSANGFKCFSEATSFDFSRLNLLTGYNGRGKSSVLQALLLLSQSIKKNGDLENLTPQGCFVKLGSFRDILSDQRKTMNFRFHCPEGVVELQYRSISNNIWSGEISSLKINGIEYFEKPSDLSSNTSSSESKKFINSSYPKDFYKSLDNFHYISADRLGPTMYEEKEEIASDNPLGCHGEHRLNMLASDNDLKTKIAKILEYIMDGGEMSIVGTDDKYEVLSSYFSFNKFSKSIKAINVGYGYSYILPIILLSQTVNDGTIFIENPEAHLHPIAQSRLMQVLCSIPKEKNVQFFIETHSEHILNAVRLACLKEELPISNSETQIYFFDKDFSIKKLNIDEDGQIPDWPYGFFDQTERDIAEILKRGMFK